MTEARYTVRHRWDGSFSITYTRGDRAREMLHYVRRLGIAMHDLALVGRPRPVRSFLDTLEDPWAHGAPGLRMVG